MLKLLSYLLIPLLFTACSFKNQEIADVKDYPQNPSLYTNELKLPKLNQEKLSKEFKKSYFHIWDLEKLSYSKKQASWGNIYSKRTIYLENHRLASKEWFKEQIDNSNFQDYNSVLKKAILTKNSDFKVFPTNSKMFYNPSTAGEGFPFDYNQNSRVKINTPVLISHYSKDKAWAYVQSNYVLGWVRIDNFLIVEEEEQKSFKENDLYIVIKEGFELLDKNHSEDLKIGTFFPKKDEKYLLATSNGIKEISINDNKISKFPLEFNKKNIEKLSTEFIGELYGWGGLNNHRDCSSFTQDFFSPFGIYLKRNSGGQTQLHKYIELSKLSNYEKKKYIKNHAIPFLTLIYLRGHIMLYIGTYDDEPLVMHNVWGVKTKVWFTQGRKIIGKTVITTLEPGIEIFNADHSKTILNKVKGMVLLNQQTKKPYEN